MYFSKHTIVYQGAHAAMACYDMVLAKIKAEHPDITHIYEKCDNATSFKCSDFLLCRPAIAKKHGLIVSFMNRKDTNLNWLG